MRKVLISLFTVSALGLFAAGCQTSDDVEVPEALANATEIVTESIEEIVEAVSPSNNATDPASE